MKSQQATRMLGFHSSLRAGVNYSRITFRIELTSEDAVSKPLVYIDQNVLEPLVNRVPSLSDELKVQWVYSKEHFTEIRRSSNPSPYLTALDTLDAKLIELELVDWKITDSAKLIDGPTAFEHYSKYCDALTDVDVNDQLFDPFQAWVNGGGSEQLLRELPEHVAEQILSLTEGLPVEQRSTLRAAAAEIDLAPIIGKMIARGNNINKTREDFGNGKGQIGQITGNNQLMKIWALIRPTCNGITPDQFFGFDPSNKQGYEAWPIYLGIIGCCAVLDIVGFQAEKKCRKLEKLQNVRSDSGHIAMGAFCSAILSADKRLIKRAEAIYEYQKIGTASLHFHGVG